MILGARLGGVCPLCPPKSQSTHWARLLHGSHFTLLTGFIVVIKEASSPCGGNKFTGVTRDGGRSRPVGRGH